MAMASRYRWDHQEIFSLIPEGASVLDLGCGDGELLASLIKEKRVHGLGIEKNLERVAETVGRGVPVLHLDLDQGLAEFPDQFFDYVLLEKTLQTVTKPLVVMDEMLRVGKHGVISFPNFGHPEVTSSLVVGVRMPVTPNLPYQWYDTPNIHLFTVNDFMDLCEEKGIEIKFSRVWKQGKVTDLAREDFYLAEEVMFVVSRKQ
ncbi:MAG: methionine biosynthesis protein MetW [Methylocystaceae bacterium]